MHGKIINLDDVIIDINVNSILIMKNKLLKKESKCLKCGICNNICPVGIMPYLLKNNNYRKSVINKCLKCGLCSYICPVYIDLINYIELIKTFL